MEIRVLTPENWDTYSEGLSELEGSSRYPLGSDFFRLDHGPSYFRFFERLGQARFHIAMDQGRVIACAAGVLRRIPERGRMISAWYLCDLKVRPESRGQKISYQLMRHSFFRNYWRCGRGYAISMNPSVGINPVIGILARAPYLPFRVAGQLHIFSLTHSDVVAHLEALRKELGAVSFLSLQGKKDLILQSTGQRLNLIHIQHGPMAEPQLTEPVPGATHMICAPEGSALCAFLQSRMESSTATILSHRLGSVDWRFILTSEI